MSLHGGTSAFLLQTRQEFFDPFTPDSLSATSSSHGSLIEELENIAGWAATDSRWGTQVELIKAELRHVAAAETTFLESLPRTIGRSPAAEANQNRATSYVWRELFCRNETPTTNERLPHFERPPLDFRRQKKPPRTAIGRVATNFVQAGRTVEEALGLVTEANLLKPSTGGC